MAIKTTYTTSKTKNDILLVGARFENKYSVVKKFCGMFMIVFEINDRNFYQMVPRTGLGH